MTPEIKETSGVPSKIRTYGVRETSRLQRAAPVDVDVAIPHEEPRVGKNFTRARKDKPAEH